MHRTPRTPKGGGSVWKDLSPTYDKIRRARASAKLVVRENVTTESPFKGNVRRGEAVLLLDEIRELNGTVRARIARESSPRGLCVETLGWVTMEKDGELKLDEIPDSESSPRGIHQPLRRLSQRSNSMASRIALRRQQMAQEREEARKSASAPGPASSASQPAPGAPAAPTFTFVWMSAEEVRAKLHMLEAEVEREENSHDTLASKLGRWLLDNHETPDHLASEWDRNKVSAE